MSSKEEIFNQYFLVPKTRFSQNLVAKEREYLGASWISSYFKLLGRRASMPTLRDFASFLDYLSSGKTVYDGNKKPVDSVDQTLNNILTPKEGRGEFIDARFVYLDGKMHIAYHTLNFGTRREVIEPLEECLMERKNIDLFSWLRNPTAQGLPRNDVPPGNLEYLPPMVDGVTWFESHPEGMALVCSGDQWNSDENFGTRLTAPTNALARILTPKNL